MGDIKNPKVLYAKAGMFVFMGTLASVLLIIECPTIKVGFLLAIAIWSFARAYYFPFYVIEHYIDPSYKFAGLWSFAKYVVSRKRSAEGKIGNPPIAQE